MISLWPEKKIVPNMANRISVELKNIITPKILVCTFYIKLEWKALFLTILICDKLVSVK